jgi:hypothetical protein
MVTRFLLLSLVACTSAAAAPAPPASSAAPIVAAKSEPAPDTLPISAYAWGPAATDERLNVRFAAPPAGFARVETAPETFGRFLRALPLQAAGAPVVDYRGTPLHDHGKHPNIVAVADLDIGAKDLQHCADVIIRLHAEWRYGKGERNLSYRSVSGQTLSYQGYVGGDRAIVRGKGIALERVAAPAKDSHALMRGWMDEVFSWAGTASLEPYSKKVAWSDVAPGDFFVMSGSPFGHAVLILDVAKDDKGRVALLLGQSYMPAQSFQILKPAGGNNGFTDTAWFVVEPNDQLVDTPLWPAFPKTALRRM